MAAGTATWSTYAATTCAGENPMDFSTPMRRVPATTAPLTTLITISTDIASPISPNATMNGTHGANEAVACALAVSQDCVPSTLPCGSAPVTAAMSAFTAAVVAALEKRYSICDSTGAPAACSAAISPGVTQPCAVPVTDVAMPTTVSFGEPGTPVSVSCDPIPAFSPEALDSTICPGPVGQGQLLVDGDGSARSGLPVSDVDGRGDLRRDRDARLGERPGRGGHARQVGGGGQLGRRGPGDGGRHGRAVLSGERVIEGRVRVDQQAEPQRRGRGGDQYHQADHDGLHAPSGQPAERGPDHGNRLHAGDATAGAWSPRQPPEANRIP